MTRHPASRQRGFSLVELLVACLLGLILMGGVIKIMLTVSTTARVTNGTARIQENGRFALAEMARRLRGTSEMLCLSYSGNGLALTGSATKATEAHRAMDVLFDATAAPLFFGFAPQAAGYEVDAASFVRGFECDAAGDCTPDLSTFPPLAGASALPAVAVADGGRAKGSDVLFVRQLEGEGLRVVAQSSTEADGQNARLTLDGSPAALGVSADTPVLIGDCATSVLARVDADGSDLVLSSNFNDDVMPGMEIQHQAYAFNAAALSEAVYYVGFRQAQSQDGARLVSSLLRSDGDGTTVIADGVERFDVLYHVEDINGLVSVLDAEDVGGFAGCKATEGDAALLAINSGPCGWRSLIGVEIHLLVNSVENVDSNADITPFRYAWTNAGAVNATGAMELPSVLGSLTSGLAPNGELRSHFSTFVALRSRIQ